VKNVDSLKIGDIVARRSYGGDVYFRIVNTIDKKQGTVYVLRGLTNRLEADSHGSDLIKHNHADIQPKLRSDILTTKQHASRTKSLYRFSLLSRFRSRPGRILHLDADNDFLQMCLRHYAEANIWATGRLLSVSDQPLHLRNLLNQYRPDILVLTGHDGIKKDTGNLYSVDNYSSSKYFIQSVKEARAYESDFDRLCIFAGACQSYYEGIMEAGANFASSPGRVLINALDPAFVSEKVALTDTRAFVSPQEIANITKSGSKGIWGIDTRGHLSRV
jgi:spore coat assembly protein